MDLVFIITSNEIRIFKASQQDISPFFIDGEDIFEYEDNDFAQDLKDKILTILNEKSFCDIAVHIAYTADEKSAAESILREFVPCRLIQAVVFDDISDPSKTAKQIQTISRNKSAEFEDELAQSNITIKQQTDMISALKSEMDKQSAEYDSLKNEYASLQKSYKSLEKKNKSLVKDNQSMKEICESSEKFFSAQRHRCYYTEKEASKSVLMDINWKKNNGEIFTADSYGIQGELGDLNFKKSETTNYEPSLNDLSYKSLTIKYEKQLYTSICYRSEWTYKLVIKNAIPRDLLLIIIKSVNIAPNETFAVLTHPNDTEEAVLKWLEQTSDEFSKKLQSQSDNQVNRGFSPNIVAGLKKGVFRNGKY